MVWDLGDTLIKGCSLGVIVSISSEALTSSLSVARCMLSAIMVRPFGKEWLRARWPRDEHGVSGSISKWRLQQDLSLLLEVALTDPQQLLSGRVAYAFKRLLRNVHRLATPAGELPWQLVLIHQRVEAVLDLLSYDDLCAFFGAGNPSPPALCEAALARLLKRRKFRPVPAQLRGGLGAGQHSACPICMQDFSTRMSAIELPHCRHAYHSSCAAKWLQLRGDCPVCRHVITMA